MTVTIWALITALRYGKLCQLSVILTFRFHRRIISRSILKHLKYYIWSSNSEMTRACKRDGIRRKVDRQFAIGMLKGNDDVFGGINN